VALLRIFLSVVSVAVLLGGCETTTVSPANEGSAPIFRHLDIDLPRIDLYGNEINDAVGDYRIDAGGVLYERHRPHLALPKLGPPST
jgi:hypothetical protein